MSNDVNENLRELCSAGDLKLVKSYIELHKPELNSQNKVNGWTALHWACKRNFLDIVKFLIQNGASDEIANKDGKKPSFYAKDKEILELLTGVTNFAQGVVNEEEPPKSNFVPSFLKFPDFSHLRHFDENQVKKNETTIKASFNNENEITIKMRTQLETDFIEVDFDPNDTSFEKFKLICKQELDLNYNEIIKIRKLPNIIIRNDKDIKRIKNGQEIEILI